MINYPKAIKRQLRELAGQAYQREMERELGKLAASFDAWRAGEIDCWELHKRVHGYHNGAARELYKSYATTNRPDLNVAYAVVTGILDRATVPTEVLDALRNALMFYESLKADGELKLPE